MPVYTRDCVCDRTYEGLRINSRNCISNLQVNRDKYRKRTTIFDIFEFYWSDFSSRYSDIITRKAIHYNVESMLACGTRELGYASFECTNCNNFHIINFTCNQYFVQNVTRNIQLIEL